MNSRHRQFRKNRSLNLEALESRRPFTADSEVLVDFTYRPERNESALTDNGIFFVRDDARYGTELWTTNTSGSLPRIVVDLTPGEQGSNISSVTPVEGGVYFINSLVDHRKQLWWSDGTASNTRMVIDHVALLERNLAERGSITTLPSNGRQVFFMRRGVSGNTTYLMSGLWATSDGGSVVQRLTSNDSFADATGSGWGLQTIESFQEIEDGRAVFIISASRSLEGMPSERRRFFGVTDGTVEGTRLSDLEVPALANIREAVALSDEKIMFEELSTGNRSRVLTIDRHGDMDQLAESLSAVPSEFKKSGSSWFFSTNSNHRRVLFRTDGTPAGTEIVPSAGPVHSSPTTLSDGSVLTLAGENYYDRDFQVTNPETLETTTLEFILPSDGGLIRSVYGAIVVGVDKFFYVETQGNHTRRLTMADMQTRTVTTVFDGDFNSAIGAPILKGDKLFFTHVAPDRSELIQFNIEAGSSTTLASIATDGWQGLSIDAVGDDSLIGLMQGVDQASIFKLRFADSKLDVVSVVDEALSTGDLYADVIRGSMNGPHWMLDTKTIAFSSEVVVNQQIALAQYLAYDTSASGLTRLLPASLPQPSTLRSGAIYIAEDQPLYRAGGKVIYHSGYQVIRGDGNYWHEIWSAPDGGPAQKLMQTKSTGINGEGNLIPMGVVDDLFYFLSTGPTTRLYRTNADATAVEVVTDAPWGREMIMFNNYKLLYRPTLVDDPQRILFYRVESSSVIGVWEIAGTPSTLTKIAEYSGDGNLLHPNTVAKLIDQSSGALVLMGTASRGPLVEDTSNESSIDPMVSFFNEGESLTLAQQSAARLYRLGGAWVAAVAESDATYSFWSRIDGSTGATRVSEIDLTPFKSNPWSAAALLDFAMTSDAVVFTTGSVAIRLQRDGTYSLIDVPYTGPIDFYSAKSRLDNSNGLRDDSILGVGTSLETYGIFSLDADGRSFQELFVPEEKHGVVFEQIYDDSARFVLTAPWPHLRPTKITRILQDRSEVETVVDRPAATLSLAVDRVVLQSEGQTLHNSAASELHRLSIQTTIPASTVTIDIGTAEPSRKFPVNGVTLTLTESSTIRLVGSTSSSITYELDDEVLKITIGALTMRVLSPGDVVIEDHLAADRNWVYSAGNDDVEIRPSGTNATEIIEQLRNVAIRVVDPTEGEGEAPGNVARHWRINMRTGSDKLTVDPAVTATALLSIVADLDSHSDLSLNLPPASGPLNVTRHNGRTFARASVAELQVQWDNTRRQEHNLFKPNDADNDGLIIPLDALRILNTLASRQRFGESITDVIFGDTNGDGLVTPLDALMVINYIADQNRKGQLSGEGENHRKTIGLQAPTKDTAWPVIPQVDKVYSID